jgi:hypothetical protein
LRKGPEKARPEPTLARGLSLVFSPGRHRRTAYSEPESEALETEELNVSPAESAVACGSLGCGSGQPLYHVDLPDRGDVVLCPSCAQRELGDRRDQDDAEDQATDPGHSESPVERSDTRNVEVGGSGGQGVRSARRARPAGKGRLPPGEPETGRESPARSARNVCAGWSA